MADPLQIDPFPVGLETGFAAITEATGAGAPTGFTRYTMVPAAPTPALGAIAGVRLQWLGGFGFYRGLVAGTVTGVRFRAFYSTAGVAEPILDVTAPHNTTANAQVEVFNTPGGMKIGPVGDGIQWQIDFDGALGASTFRFWVYMMAQRT